MRKIIFTKYIYIFGLMSILLLGCETVTVPHSETTVKDDIILYENMPYTGIVYGNYENGQKKSEFAVKDGIIDGVAKDWYENGQLKRERSYKSNIPNGEDRGWYESGQLKYEAKVKDGKFHGTCKEWYESGELQNEWIYENGVLIN